MPKPIKPKYNLESLMRTEWILPNGLGGYASSTISGVNTRKYHGLLVGGFDPEGARHLYLATCGEILQQHDHRYFFSTHKYTPDAVYPRGFIHLVDYGIEHDQVWMKYANFGDEDLVVTRYIRVIPGHNAIAISYRFEGSCSDYCFGFRPFITYRNIHSVKSEAPYHSERGDGWNTALPFAIDLIQKSIDKVRYQGLEITIPGHAKKLFLLGAQAKCEDVGDWYHNFQYDRELERGYEYMEDLYRPATYWFDAASCRDGITFYSILDDSYDNVRKLIAKDKAQASEQTTASSLELPAGLSKKHRALLERWQPRLQEQLEDFFVHDQDGAPGVIAGYPWFGIWSRDSLLSAKGLLHSKEGSKRVARMLRTIASHAHEGLVPNILEENDKRYDFLGDSSLWFVLAVYYHYQQEQDQSLIKELWPVLMDIIGRYLRSDGDCPRLDADGLIVLSNDGSKAATWMDVVSDGRAVTPRYGKPVEIQALWYNALMICSELESTVKGLSSRLYEQMLQKLPGEFSSDLDGFINRVEVSFQEKFWDGHKGYLADFVADSVDWKIRPNQLFACSLPFALIDTKQAKSMLKVADEHLLTGAGLRTLAPGQEGYRGFYGGSQRERDAAYHQGTIWPWLLGPYARACFFAGHKDQNRLMKQLCELFSLCDSNDIYYIPEVFSSDDLHPDGTIHQAWNVAEIYDILNSIQTV